MIEYLIAHNPNDRILRKAYSLINEGGLVCLPTDTNWVICCSPFHKKGVDRLYKLKGEEKSKHFSLLCPNISIATDVAVIDSHIFRQIKSHIPGCYTFIFNATKKITKHLKASKTDQQVGLRFPPGEFIQIFLEKYNDGLLSTNIVPEMLEFGDEMPIYSYLIEEGLSHKIDLILDPEEIEFLGESTIIDFTESEPQLIREGVGALF
ncbi:MAG: L-threonylcarbamoyladenylate synthase [Bdellovibrionales bacterium]|nr:L-threonylcarbamoyladenylate synthase [Bdellovibrionales bacterium]